MTWDKERAPQNTPKHMVSKEYIIVTTSTTVTIRT